MGENLNAVRLTPIELEELIGLADLALSGSEYEPYDTGPDDSPDFKVYSGSIRSKNIFDGGSGQTMRVDDFVGLTRERDIDRATRRLMIVWGDGNFEEVDLDTGEVILGSQVNLTCSPQESRAIKDEHKEKITRALFAVVEDDF